MTEVIRFCILGLGTGALYTLMAVGLVLVYRTTGVVNFAAGAMGMVGAFAFWELNVRLGVAWPIGFVAGLLASAFVGLLTYALAIRRLGGAAPLVKIIVTLGVLTILQSLALLRYPSELTVVPAFLPEGQWELLGISVVKNRVIIFLIVVVTVLVLATVYRRTKFGLASTAVAENPQRAAAFGTSPDRIAAVNWALGGALAGMAGMLIAPISGLGATQLTILVIPALAAAIFGRMVSFPFALVGGLVIGVSQSLTNRYVETPGLADAVPFVIVAIVLLVRGGAIAPRGLATQRLPAVGTGVVRPGLVVVLSGIVLVLLWLVLPIQWIDAVSVTLLVATLLLSQVVVTGYSAQLSLAQVTLAGIGALVAAQLVVRVDMPFELALVLAVLAGLLVGCVVGFICCTRTRGVELAVITLGLAVSVEALVFNVPNLTGGNLGLPVGPQSFLGIDVDALQYPARYGTLSLVAFALTALVVTNVRRGRVGRRMVAVRANERGAASLGIAVVEAKIYAFVLGAGIAALAGVLLAFRQYNVTTGGQYGPLDSIAAVMETVVGGVGWVAGAVIGSTFEAGTIGARISDVFGPSAEKYLFLVAGIFVVFMAVTAPDGFAGLKRDAVFAVVRRVRGKDPRPARLLEPTDFGEASTHRVAPMLLEAEGVTVVFGGIEAVSDVSIKVAPGEVVGLIGPNGAGKTTLVEALSGFVPLAAGDIELHGESIHRWSRERRARAGLGRSFQNLELFEDMTVFENLLSAAETRDRRAYLTDLVHPGKPKLTDAGLAVVRHLHLQPDLLRVPRELPYGRRRIVAIARSVAAEPSIIALDEAAAGLSDVEVKELTQVIRDLSQEWGMGVLLIEHNVSMIMGICDRIYVMQAGKCIADGTPATIRDDPRVIDAYLGTLPPPGDGGDRRSERSSVGVANKPGS